jgi:hypothetical protein
MLGEGLKASSQEFPDILLINTFILLIDWKVWSDSEPGFQL